MVFFMDVGEQSHGQHDRQKSAGSLDNSSDTSRVMKGFALLGRMGGKSENKKGLKGDESFPRKDIS